MYRIFVLVLFIVGCSTTEPSSDSNKILFEEVKVLAESGNANAIHKLCYRYSYGYDGAPKDYEQAFHWCNKSVENNNSSSITLLAELYYLGNFVEQNYYVALVLYEKASLLGHSHAQKMLYRMYKEGQGVKPNKVFAEFWIKKSAAGGDEQAKKIVSKLPN